MTHEVADCVRDLTAWADDPMWADHAEVPKSLLRRAASFLSREHNGPPCPTCGFKITKGPEDYVLPDGWVAKIYQHVGWLKQYAELTSEDNWRDMRDMAIRQLGWLSDDLLASVPPRHIAVGEQFAEKAE